MMCMFKYKINIIETLKSKGFNTTIIAKDKLLPGHALQDIRNGKVVGIYTLDKICNLLDCQLSDIVEHVKDELNK